MNRHETKDPLDPLATEKVKVEDDPNSIWEFTKGLFFGSATGVAFVVAVVAVLYMADVIWIVDMVDTITGHSHVTKQSSEAVPALAQKAALLAPVVTQRPEH
jgi:hypothetical protein